MRVTLWIIFLALAMTACGSRQSGLATDAKLIKSGDAAPLMVAADALWAKRGERKAAEAAIAKWEEAAKVDPTLAAVHLKLVYAYYFMANVHVRWDEDPDAAMLKLYDQGIKAGENALRISEPTFAEQIKKGVKWEVAVKKLGIEAVPALYWQATHLGKWALLDGFTTILAEKDKVAATIEHVKSLDESFFYGAPHRYFGVYRTKIPFPGGDLPASKTHFERAIELAPNYLDTKVLFAENYAVKVQDEALFRSLLKAVIATPEDIEPALIPENRNAIRQAKYLLENFEDHF